MTELQETKRLRQIARVVDQPDQASRRLVPVLHWSVDPDTGRAEGRWILAEKPAGGCR
jgi:hypothetical protein